MRSDAVLERLTRLHPKLIDLSLGRIERLLAALGNPERRLPPVVHVAGTNGKGSTLAFMKAIAEAQGMTAHVYTSPHLVRFHERIATGGTPIDEASLTRLLEECEAANDGQPITFFEITTAAAFLEFSRRPADLALIETGLGGRFDATNVMARPAVSVITPIAMDHMSFLGETLADIAGEKAGILREGGVCAVAGQQPEAAEVIEARARALGARLVRRGAEWDIDDDGNYRDARGRLALPATGLAGSHQVSNAGLAVAALRTLADKRPGDEAIRRGVARAHWPGRLQRLEQGPGGFPPCPGWELWLDGAHNPSAAEALAESLRLWPPRKLYLVVGMLENRDPVAFLAALAPLAAHIACVPVSGDSPCWPPEALAGRVSALGVETSAHGDVAGALSELAGLPAGRILICGSLYLAGAVLAEVP